MFHLYDRGVLVATSYYWGPMNDWADAMAETFGNTELYVTLPDDYFD